MEAETPLQPVARNHPGIPTLLLLCLALLTAFRLQAAAPSYTIQYIAGLDGSSAGALSMNDLGQIVSGNSFWDGSALHTLPSLGGGSTYAMAINNLGQIVGRSWDATKTMQPVLWQNGSISTLPNLGGEEGFATCINNRGQVAGYTDNARGGSLLNLRATFWPTPGTAVDVGALPGQYASAAWAINNLGHILCSSSPSSGSGFNNGAFLYNGSSALPILTGLDPSQFTLGGLNDNDQVVGTYLSQAFVWRAGSLQSLGSLAPGFSRAFSINGAGQIVGDTSTTVGGHAFVYADGQMLDLNSLVTNPDGWNYLGVAVDINDSGQILGLGQRTGHFYPDSVFLLTPVPEPATAALLLVAAVLAASSRRLKQLRCTSRT